MRRFLLASILREVQRHFGFLYEKGYSIKHADYDSQHFGNWIVIFESSATAIEIYSDRGAILLALRPRRSEGRDGIGLEAMIYFLSHEQEFVEGFKGNLLWGKNRQYERLARLLREYIDLITPYFGSEYETYRRQLMLAQEKYNELALEKHLLDRKRRQ